MVWNLKLHLSASGQTLKQKVILLATSWPASICWVSSVLTMFLVLRTHGGPEGRLNSAQSSWSCSVVSGLVIHEFLHHELPEFTKLTLHRSQWYIHLYAVSSLCSTLPLIGSSNESTFAWGCGFACISPGRTPVSFVIWLADFVRWLSLYSQLKESLLDTPAFHKVHSSRP